MAECVALSISFSLTLSVSISHYLPVINAIFCLQFYGVPFPISISCLLFHGLDSCLYTSYQDDPHLGTSLDLVYVCQVVIELVWVNELVRLLVCVCA